MPLAGFTCPPWSPTAGTQNQLEHCLGGCQHQCVSPLLLNAMWKAERDNHHKGAYISASMLSATGCARQTLLERMEPFYEVPTRRWWPFRGTIIHAVIENAGVNEMLKYGWLQELRMSVPIKYDMAAPELDETGTWTGEFLDKPLVITLGGTTDGYNCRTRELHDFKSMADVKVEMFAAAGAADNKWTWQLNVYRWLIMHTKTPKKVRKMFPDMPEFLPEPTDLVVQGIGMMGIPRTGRRFGMRRKKSNYYAYEETEIENIPLLPLEDVEDFIRRETLRWYRTLVLGQTPDVVPESEAWLCRSCAFNGELVKGGTCFPSQERDVIVISD